MSESNTKHERNYVLTSDLLEEAIRVLTAAGRQTLAPLAAPAETPCGASEQRQTLPYDWADFVARALAGAAANIGGVEAILSGRPESWEAGAVRELLHRTVGHDEYALWTYRTEPVAFTIDAEQILSTCWPEVGRAYDQARTELERRRHALNRRELQARPRNAGTHQQSASSSMTPEGARAATQITALEEALEQDWVDQVRNYGQMLALEARALVDREMPGLTVPVTITVRGVGDHSPQAARGGDLTETFAASAATRVHPLLDPPLARIERVILENS